MKKRQISIRLSEDLFKYIEEKAEDMEGSMNVAIVQLIKKGVKTEKRKGK